jgi:site-specific recombinase XerD
MLDRCHNVRTVQKILGHLNVATTDRYLGQVGLEEMRAAI